MRSADLDRRTFLARLGLLGAVAGGSLVMPNLAGIAAASTTQELIPLLRQILAEMTRDTFNGLAVFIAPGPDPYSVAQGAPHPAPGGIEARTPEFLITLFDEVVTLPDDLARAMAGGLAGGLAGVPFPNPDDLPDAPPGTVRSVAEAVQIILTGPDLPPLSQLVGLLLNLVATLVNPASATGDFLSPFARLSLGHKAVVVSLLEDPDSPVFASIGSQFPPPLGAMVTGMVLYLVGAGIMSVGTFGTYSEWSTFDPATRTLTGRPVGWEISGFRPGVLDGWDDFRGYYRGRTKVRG